MIDKTQRVLCAAVLPGNCHDAEGARTLLPSAHRQYPRLRCVLGDKAYRQQPLADFAAKYGICLDGDSPSLPKGVIFKPMPLRWKVEQFFAWFSKWRRTAKNWCYSLEDFSRDIEWTLFGLTLRRAVVLS